MTSSAAAPIYPVRSVFGGLLMGIANVVPGISGGAMLLLVGVYQRFIDAIADVTTLRWKFRSFVFLGLVAFGAGLAILLSAGPIKNLILTHRWQTFSLFIGLRLGAIPVVMKWARPMNAKVWTGIVAGLVITAALGATQYLDSSGSAASQSTPLTRFAGGLAGASATILPGMDGSYFLLLMGEYVPILSGIDRFKDALIAFDIKAMWDAGLFLLPVALGVAIGLGGVSTLLRWLFKHHRQAVAGVLLGVVVGAIGGLWPFREGVPPQVGEVTKGVTITAENASTIDPSDWRMAFFGPTPLQIAASLGLVALGIGLAYLMSRLDPEEGRLEAGK